MNAWVEECCWVELYKFHIANHTTSAMHHGNAVACSNEWISRSLVHIANAACGQHGHFAQKSINMLIACVERINAITLDIRRVACHNFAQMMLCENIYRKIVFKHRNIGVRLNPFD